MYVGVSEQRAKTHRAHAIVRSARERERESWQSGAAAAQHVQWSSEVACSVQQSSTPILCAVGKCSAVLNIFVSDDGLRFGPYLQTGILHYFEKDFVNKDVLRLFK